MTNDLSLALRAEQNLLYASAVWTAAAGGVTLDLGAVVCTVTPVSMRSFNHIFVREALADAAPLRDAVARFEASPHFRVRARDDLALSDDVVAAAGLMLRGGMPSMALTPVRSQDLASGDLDVLEVTDATTLADHIAVVAASFDWRAEELARVFTPRLLADDAWSAWVGYADGRPVATTQLVLSGDTGGIYYVGTLEAHRGKGYGALVTRAAVSAAAAHGCTLVSLQASPMGRPVYERIGFRRVADYLTYVPAD